MTRRIEPPESCNVFTPAILATALVRTLKDDPAYCWLEPCVGKGAFLKALSQQRISRDRITGIDLCRMAEPADSKATVERGREFLHWASCTTQRFDRVVANPPYIALSSLPVVVQTAAKSILTPDGSGVPKSANCWYAFLCATVSLLKSGGSLGFVLPASFEFANYAANLRNKLPTLFANVEVHRSRSPIFENVEDGSIVLIARGYLCTGGTARHYLHDDLANLVDCLNNRKAESPKRAVTRKGETGGVPFSEIMEVGLGAVTGDAGYFLLTEEARLEHNLPVRAVVPVVTKSAHIEHSHLTDTVWQSLRDAGERVWLFRPSLKLTKHPQVKKYLGLDVENQGCRRNAYKIRNRTPWFQMTVPADVDGFLSGMASGGPWLSLNRKQRLSASNTLYVVRFVNDLSKAEKEAWALMLLTSKVRRQLNEVSRRYPLGLRKLEPCDLRSLRLPTPQVTVGMSTKLKLATRAFLSGDTKVSERIANEVISKS